METAGLLATLVECRYLLDEGNVGLDVRACPVVSSWLCRDVAVAKTAANERSVDLVYASDALCYGGSHGSRKYDAGKVTERGPVPDDLCGDRYRRDPDEIQERSDRERGQIFGRFALDLVSARFGYGKELIRITS